MGRSSTGNERLATAVSQRLASFWPRCGSPVSLSGETAFLFASDVPMPLSEWWRERERERLHCLDVPATLVFPVLQRENRNSGSALLGSPQLEQQGFTIIGNSVCSNTEHVYS